MMSFPLCVLGNHAKYRQYHVYRSKAKLVRVLGLNHTGSLLRSSATVCSLVLVLKELIESVENTQEFYVAPSAESSLRTTYISSIMNLSIYHKALRSSTIILGFKVSF